MFNSLSNNFGAGTIQFKDYQCDKYVVLNAKFQYNPLDPAYLAADHLEIRVPNLSIDRSIETPVILSFEQRDQMSSRIYIFDGSTVLKSWIKDKNTICIEKFPNLDAKQNLTIWIQSMYSMKNQHSDVIRLAKTAISFSTNPYYISPHDETAIVTDHWVFFASRIENGDWEYEDSPWEVTISGLPTDINTDIIIAGGQNARNSTVGGASFGTLSGGVLSIPFRCRGFGSTDYRPFIYGYFVRDGNN